MLKVLVVCCVATVWLQMLSGVDGKCCYKHEFRVTDPITGQWRNRKVCGDCSDGNTYCGRGSCNIFGCNCDGGCREGTCEGSELTIQVQERGLRMRSEDARDVIRAADVDGDGRMSLEEATLHLASTGLPADHVKRALEQLDYNQDQFITAHEVDSDYNELETLFN